MGRKHGIDGAGTRHGQDELVAELRAENERLTRLLGHASAENPGSSVLAMLMNENARMRETLQGIRDANWRTWDNASADECVAWAQSRARHVLQELPNADVVRLDAAGGQSERT